jgi:phosphoribosylformimino-5-aminoimidazole carboxamide ribonucleotide (ProFAR) isomerase
MKTRVLTLLAIAVLAVTGTAFAHHGAAAYDMGKAVTVKGVVSDFQFINPHVLITIDVKGDDGSVQKWQGELTSPNHLARAGWTKSTIKVGDTITLMGAGAKSGSPTVWIRKIVAANGEPISLGGGGDN